MTWHVLAGYLERSDPDALTALRAAHPDATNLLSGAMKLGTPSRSAPDPAFQREAALALARATADGLVVDIEALLVEMKARMRRVRTIRLGGALASTIAGAATALVALLFKGSEASKEIVSLCTAVVTMLGGLCALFAEHFEQTSTGARFSGAQSLGELAEHRADVELFRIRERQDTVVPLTDDELKSSLDRLNAVALKVLRYRYVEQ